MFTIKDFKVELINANDVKNFVENHGKVSSVCYNTDEKYAKSVGKDVLKTGHFSGSRGDYFKFKITVIPRDAVDQCTRHDVGTYKNVQSLRYVNKENLNLYCPPEVENDDELLMIFQEMENTARKLYGDAIKRLETLGYSGEKANELARHLVPIGVESAFSMGFTLEALMNFMNKRLCSCAEAPIRRIAQLMKDEVMKVAPIYEPYLVPICERYLFCPENKKRSCGKAPVKEELLKILKEQ